MKSRFLFLIVAFISLVSQTKAQSPNIIVILVDDLGYGDINLQLENAEVFKNPNIQTPNLKRLAEESLVMTHHYAASPVCSPSRAGLLTGRTPTRCNINQYINDKNENDKTFLHGSEITIAEILKTAGYNTAIFGKWHLNGADWEEAENWNGWTGSFPKQQGFDYGIICKEDPHFTRHLNVNTQKHPGDYFSVDGQPLGAIKGYSSDIISEKAVDWFKEVHESKEPFFAFLSYDAVHIRIAAADKYEAMYNTGDARKDAYFANITHLDAAIGTVLDGLDKLGIAENTIVIFSSDNGPDVLRVWEATYFCYGTSYPLTGSKYQLYEGGIRVPGMVRWTGKISPGISSEPNCTLDLLPTFCELTNQKIPSDRAIDGASMLNFWLSNEKIAREKPLYWQYEYSRVFEETQGNGYERRIWGPSINRETELKPRAAIRDGEYVLIGLGAKEFKAPEKFQLFNLIEDPEQKNNLIDTQKDKFSKMKAELLSIHAEVQQDREKTEKSIADRKDKISFH